MVNIAFLEAFVSEKYRDQSQCPLVLREMAMREHTYHQNQTVTELKALLFYRRKRRACEHGNYYLTDLVHRRISSDSENCNILV